MVAILSISSSVLLLVLYVLYRKYSSLQADYKKLFSAKRSTEVLTGHTIEKLLPFSKEFDYSIRDLQFLGMPIDYIHFGADVITFIEVKSGQSKLSAKQRKIKKLIQNKKVEWDEIRIKHK